MLIIDEIHNILAGKVNQRQEFLNLMRFLGNELSISLVGAGTKDAYMAIRSDDQLENRFEPLTLPRWELNKEFVSLLSTLESLLPLRKPSQLNDATLASKILSISEGIIGEVTKIISLSAIMAIETGKESIDIKLIEKINYLSPTERRQQFAQISM